MNLNEVHFVGVGVFDDSRVIIKHEKTGAHLVRPFYYVGFGVLDDRKRRRNLRLLLTGELSLQRLRER